MIIKIILNLQTLETTLEDSGVVINEIKMLDDGQIMIELSKPDPEITLPTGP
jgi:chaperonin cofactor prefoldin